MADISQTTSSVVAVGSSVSVITATSGDALTTGNMAYKATNGNWLPSKSNGNSAQAGASGLAVCLSTAPGGGQKVVLFLGGTVNLGATLQIGETYVISANTGRICPISDLATNNWVSILGVAQDANNLATPAGGMFVSGVQHF